MGLSGWYLVSSRRARRTVAGYRRDMIGRLSAARFFGIGVEGERVVIKVRSGRMSCGLGGSGLVGLMLVHASVGLVVFALFVLAPGGLILVEEGCGLGDFDVGAGGVINLSRGKVFDLRVSRICTSAETFGFLA